MYVCGGSHSVSVIACHCSFYKGNVKNWRVEQEEERGKRWRTESYTPLLK